MAHPPKPVLTFGEWKKRQKKNGVKLAHPPKRQKKKECTKRKKKFESVELELPSSLILMLSLQAHELDITLNQHINNIVIKYADEILDRS